MVDDELKMSSTNGVQRFSLQFLMLSLYEEFGLVLC